MGRKSKQQKYEESQQILQQLSTEYPLTSYIGQGMFQAEYIGKNGICGFKNKHKYTVTLEKDQDNYGYLVEALSDNTETKEFGATIIYASMISVSQNWKEVKEE